MLPQTRRIIPALSVLALCAIALNAAAPPGAQSSDWRKSLWKVEFSLNHRIALVTPKGDAPVQTKFDGISYYVGPFPDMFVTQGTQAGSYWSELKDPDNTMTQEWRSNQAPPSLRLSLAGRRELLVGRRVDACDALLNVWTLGSKNAPGTANTFVASNNFEWPTEWKETVHSSPPVVITDRWAEGAPLYTPTEQEVPYDYRKVVNAGTVDLTDFPGPASQQPTIDPKLIQQMASKYGVTIPANALPSKPAAAPYRLIKRTITYTITRLPMEIELLKPKCSPGEISGNAANATCVGDLLGTPWLICPNCQRVSDNLGVELVRAPNGTFVRNHYIHANIAVKLKIDGQDVTDFTMPSGGTTPLHFVVARTHRGWSVPLHADNQGAGPYPPGQMGWTDDPTATGWTKNQRPNWYDMPGPAALATDLQAWPRARMVQEFLLGVKDFPEFGFIYYATIIDTKVDGYRVRQTPARNVTADEWCRIKKSSSPQVDFTQTSLDTGWQPAPPRRTH